MDYIGTRMVHTWSSSSDPPPRTKGLTGPPVAWGRARSCSPPLSLSRLPRVQPRPRRRPFLFVASRHRRFGGASLRPKHQGELPFRRERDARLLTHVSPIPKTHTCRCMRAGKRPRGDAALACKGRVPRPWGLLLLSGFAVGRGVLMLDAGLGLARLVAICA